MAEFRPDLYVLARLLSRLAAQDDWTKAKLQLAVRLNYTLFARYLEFGVGRGWIVVDPRAEGSDGVKVTDEGRKAWKQLEDWLAKWLRDSRL